MRQNYTQPPQKNDKPENNQSIKQLFESYYTILYSYLRKIGCDAALASDIIQNLFLKLILKTPEEIEGLKQKGNMYGYLAKAAHNLYIDHKRKSNRARDYEDFVHNRPPKAALSPEEILIEKETKNLSHQIIEKVLLEIKIDKPISYEIYRLYEEDFSYQKIAEKTKRNINTVGVEIYRIKRKISIKLKEANLIPQD